MGSVLIPWELGAGFGHLIPILTLARAFGARGHRVRVASRDVERARRLLGPHGIEVLAAPCRRAPPRPFALSHNYGENLLRNGYWHAETLRANLRDWLALFERCQPDAVVCDHSPTALLAARHAGVSRAAFGVGFMVPPRTDPMHPLQPWFALPRDYYVASEKKFVDTVNPVLRALGMHPLSAVADIFEGAETFLCTWAECDHYPTRPDEQYWGPMPYPNPGRAPEWPQGDGPRTFVYVSGRNCQFNALVDALRGLRTPVLAYVRDATPQQLEALNAAHIRVASELLDLRQVAAEADAAITHGGFGTVIEMLRAGVPTLLLPLELEQALLAYRLAERGLALQVNFLNATPALGGKLRRLLGPDRQPPEHLRSFAERYQSPVGRSPAEAMVDYCEKLAAA